MNRGDIYWVDLNLTKGSEINKTRPCVLVGATPINQARRTVVVIPLSSTKARPPVTISVICRGKRVTAICDQIRTVDKSRLSKSAVDHLSAKDLDALNDALRQVLSL